MSLIRIKNKSEPLINNLLRSNKINRLEKVRYPRPGIRISAFCVFEAGIGWKESEVDGKVASLKIVLKPGFFLKCWLFDIKTKKFKDDRLVFELFYMIPN